MKLAACGLTLLALRLEHHPVPVATTCHHRMFMTSWMDVARQPATSSCLWRRAAGFRSVPVGQDSLTWPGHPDGRAHIPVRDFLVIRMVCGQSDPATPGTGKMRSLVLRAWLESRVPPRLRVRVIEITPGRTERSMVVTSSVDEACRVVRSWLETLRAQGSNENGDGAVTRDGWNP